MKYISPALVIACSHPSGSGPMFAFDDAAFATTGFDGRNEKGHSYITYSFNHCWQLLAIVRMRKIKLPFCSAVPEPIDGSACDIGAGGGGGGGSCFE